jgi:hypothetical protein
METAMENGEGSTPGSFYGEPWFALASGDRIRVLELDMDQGIEHVEVLSGLCAGRTGWLSLVWVKHD